MHEPGTGSGERNLERTLAVVEGNGGKRLQFAGCLSFVLQNEHGSAVRHAVEVTVLRIRRERKLTRFARGHSRFGDLSRSYAHTGESESEAGSKNGERLHAFLRRSNRLTRVPRSQRVWQDVRGSQGLPWPHDANAAGHCADDRRRGK